MALRCGVALGSIVALGFSAPGIAMAQDQSPTVLEAVVVEGQGTGKGDRVIGPDKTIVAADSATATKTDTPIVETPAAVSVVTQKEMEDRGVKDLQEAISYTSGVLVDEFGSDNRYDYFRIRGFDETALGSYRDGLPARIPAWFTASRIEPYGMQRIEVLKGSNSTLFGLNAPGGIINAITKRPQDTKHGEVYTSLGDGHTEVGTDFGGPLDPDGVFSYRMTGYWQDADFGSDYSKDDHFYIAPALTISPDAGTSLTILADYGTQKREAVPADSRRASIWIGMSSWANRTSIASTPSRATSATSSSISSTTGSPSARPPATPTSGWTMPTSTARQWIRRSTGQLSR